MPEQGERRQVNLPSRKSIRIKGYDYAQTAAYFVTLCTRKHSCLLGQVINGIVQLNGVGKLVDEEWQASAEIRTEIQLDNYVIMPNHLHGIVLINASAVEPPLNSLSSNLRTGTKARSLSSFIAGFKSAVTRRIKQLCIDETSIWQRNYVERIICHEQDYYRIQQYIYNNPALWDLDPEHPNQQKSSSEYGL